MAKHAGGRPCAASMGQGLAALGGGHVQSRLTVPPEPRQFAQHHQQELESRAHESFV